MQKCRFAGIAILCVGCAGVLTAPRAKGFPQEAASNPAPSIDSPAFGDFSSRVNEYLKLRKSAPRQRTTKSREQIVDRRHDIAQAIREARPDAKQGDIFTPLKFSAQFLNVIRGTLQGSNAVASLRKTIRQGGSRLPACISR